MQAKGANIPAALLSAWRRRLSQVRQRLQQSPDATDAWFWAVQGRVVEFLLRRYDRVRTDRYTMPATSTGEASNSLWSPPELEFCSSRVLANLASTPKPLKNSQRLEPIVRNIMRSNLDRYESLERKQAEETAAFQRATDLKRFEAEWVRNHLVFFNIEEPNPPAMEPLPPRADAAIDSMIEAMCHGYLAVDAIPLPEDDPLKHIASSQQPNSTDPTS